MLVNRTTGEVITKEVDVADNPLKRGLGLMFKRSYDGALIFPEVGKTTFHGFFCFFPILLLCLDEWGKVREKILLKPWRTVRVDCATVVELDARKKWRVRLGDELSWNVD